MGESKSRIASDFRFMFKAIPGVRNGGLHAVIWLPNNQDVRSESLPLAIMSHGGGWTIGAADDIPYNQVRYCLKQGIAVAGFEYRHLPHVHLKDIREDLMDGYQFVQSRLNTALREAGSDAVIDGTRCCHLGWSAGGSNTLWLASDLARFNRTHIHHTLPPLRAVISTYPLTDLKLFSSAPSFPVGARSFDPAVDVARNTLLMGECNTAYKIPVPMSFSPTTPLPDRLAYAMSLTSTCTLSEALLGPSGESIEEASPINLIDSSWPPTCMVMATADKLIPPSQTVEFYQRLQTFGVDSLLVTCEGMEHGEAECHGGNAARWEDHWWTEAIKPSLDFAIQRMEI